MRSGNVFDFLAMFPVLSWPYYITVFDYVNTDFKILEYFLVSLVLLLSKEKPPWTTHDGSPRKGRPI